jgi:membrane-associated phospholipid phosphatase
VNAVAAFITDFGDLAVTVPLAAVTTVALGVLRLPRLALAWAASIAGCAGVVGGLKLVLDVCHHRFSIPDIISPSGHAAMSVAVYGGLALLIGSGRPSLWRCAIRGGAAVLMVAIAVTRVILHKHTAAEAAVGFAIGLVAVASFGVALAAHRAVVVPVRWLAAALLLLAVAVHGARWPGELTIHEMAGSPLVRFLISGCR